MSASSTDADIGPAGTAAIAAGLVCNPIMLYSEYVLKVTGAGLPPGPGGIYGALGKQQLCAEASSGPSFRLVSSKSGTLS